MTGLTTDLICNACRIFFSLAYPAGEAAIPAQRRLYAQLPSGHEIADYHAQHPFPAASFETLAQRDGSFLGYAFRLGSAGFRNLKLKVLSMSDHDQQVWIFSVDTHDDFSKDHLRPPPDHPDAAPWTALQKANGELKEKIERTWEEAGLLTFNALLRLGLGRPVTDPP